MLRISEFYRLLENTTMFLEVTNVRHLAEHKLRLKFSTGEAKIVDLKNELTGKVYAPLKDIDYFKQCKVAYNTVEWPNGADFAPEYLYGLNGEAEEVEYSVAADSGFEYKTKKE